MTKKLESVTLEYNVPIPDDYRGGRAKELAQRMKPDSSYLLATRNQAVAIGNAARKLGHVVVIRQEKNEKTGKVHGFRIWRES